MSLIKWITNRKSPALNLSVESSGLSHVDATVPFNASSKQHGRLPSGPAGNAANRKGERLERRELLYSVVREAMTKAGVLSSSYKFKVLSLDSSGRQYLIMMDLARQHAGEISRLAEIESLIARHAKIRHDILVTAVYWRLYEHVSVGLSRVSASTTASILPFATATTKHCAPVTPSTGAEPAYKTLHPDEVAAFRKALASVATPAPLSAPGEIVKSGRRNPAPIPEFEDTEMEERPSPLSGTQYGDL